MIQLLCISDVRTFMWIDKIINKLRPNYIAFLGDILYDGDGQFYLIGNKNSKYIEKAFQDIGLSQKTVKNLISNPKYVINKYEKYFKDAKIFINLYNCLGHIRPKLLGYDFIMIGNTHINKFLEALHINYFLDILNKCNVEKIFVISGNHDSHIDYEKYSSKIFFSDFFEFKFFDISTAFISYNAYKYGNSENLQQYDILFTHTEWKNLRFFKSKLIVNGHSTKGSSNILLINGFPCSFCMVSFFRHTIKVRLLKISIDNNLIKIKTVGDYNYKK